MQLIHQVRQALRLGLLRKGDQLPKVKDVAAGLAINPNTVLKAYRELEYEGLGAGPPGGGTLGTGPRDGMRYGRQWARSDCPLSVPAGHVVGRTRPPR